MSSYISGFSDLIEQYEKYQKASDSWSVVVKLFCNTCG